MPPTTAPAPAVKPAKPKPKPKLKLTATATFFARCKAEAHAIPRIGEGTCTREAVAEEIERRVTDLDGYGSECLKSMTYFEALAAEALKVAAPRKDKPQLCTFLEYIDKVKQECCDLLDRLPAKAEWADGGRTLVRLPKMYVPAGRRRRQLCLWSWCVTTTPLPLLAYSA